MRPARLLLFLPALLLAYLLFPVAPAHAFEKKVMGDVDVKKGETEGKVSTVWGDVLVEGEVDGDVVSSFGNIEVEGPVSGRVMAGYGDVYVNAPVGDDVNVGRGDVELGPRAVVMGDILWGSGELYDHPDAVVRGSQAAGMASDFEEGSPLEGFSDFIGWGVMTLGFAAAAVLLAVAAPRPLRASARSLESAPLRSLLLGAGSIPAMLVASVLLLFTGVGLVLLLLAWPAYLALILFGSLVAAYFLGRKVVLATGRYRAGDVLAAVVGALLVSAAYWIPIFGGFIFGALALVGTGAAVLALFASRRPPRSTHASYEAYLEARHDR